MKKRGIVFIAAILTLFSGVLVNASTFDVQQSPDTFSVNGIMIKQNAADGVFLLDKANHRSYLPVSNLLQAAGATLTQTLNHDGSSNWDFSLPEKTFDVAGILVLKAIETYTGDDGLLVVKTRVVTGNTGEILTVAVDGSEGLNISKSFPVGSNYALFVMDGRFTMIDAAGKLHAVTMKR